MMKKALVIDYSWSNGNTKRIAERLAAALGADLDASKRCSLIQAVMRKCRHKVKKRRTVVFCL